MWRLWRKGGGKDYAECSTLREIHRFTYKELEVRTMKFSRMIGRGAFGTVYYGYLEDGTEVAVKMHNKRTKSPIERIEDYYLNEAQILSKVCHKNLISLVGYCKDGDNMAIVYEYISEGSLRVMLGLPKRQSRDKSESARFLSWAERLQIAIDVAQGLDYLHNICPKPIIHGNVTTSNILLGEKLEAKLASFALAKFLDSDMQTDVLTSDIRGSQGYLAPEYMAYKKDNQKTDVYCFGVVLLEIITSQPPMWLDQDGKSVHIVGHIASRIAGGAVVDDIADPWLRGEYDANSVQKVMELAMRCTAKMCIGRPTITEVLMQLREILEPESTNSNCNMTVSIVTPETGSERSSETHQSNVDNQDAELPSLNHQFKMNHEDHQLPFGSHQFIYAELERITKKFARVLGGGGFGTVFYGSLENGTEVAVKKLAPSSKQGSNEFLAEIASLSQVRHRNLVSLVGYCKDRTCLALVYEYMPQGSLEDHLRGTTDAARALIWAERLRIALDAARGLDYLHNGLPEPIIHRDVKTSNILLSQNLEAKLSDFGLSKTFDRNLQTHVSAEPAFTPGYLDPECCSLWRFSEKTDVYSFGVVLLEIITGEPPISRLGEVVHIIERVELSLKRGNIHDIADAKLQGKYDVRSVWKIVDLAMVCTARATIQRPTMTEVVVQLRECLALETARASSSNRQQRNESTKFITASATYSSSAR